MNYVKKKGCAEILCKNSLHTLCKKSKKIWSPFFTPQKFWSPFGPLKKKTGTPFDHPQKFLSPPQTDDPSPVRNDSSLNVQTSYKVLKLGQLVKKKTSCFTAVVYYIILIFQIMHYKYLPTAVL